MTRRQKQSDKKTKTASYRVERLERRVLFSADMPFIADSFAGTQADQMQVLMHTDASVPQEESATASRFELVIIDPTTPDYQSIVDDLQQRTDADFEIYILDPDQDGLAQIDEILGQHDNVSALHLISHGADGEINLGNSSIGFVELLADAQTVSGWQDSFTAAGDFLIYGCDLAATNGGQHFVDTLAQLTGTDVAASNDLTGAAILGGDWQLEYTTGSVETELALSDTLQASYQHTLAIYTVTNLADSGAGSLREAIVNTNANGDADIIEFSVTGTINLLSSLDDISGPVTIDGSTAPSYAGEPLVILDGSGAGSATGLSLVAGSDGSTIRGLAINQFAGNGITLLDSHNHTIAGNYIGTDVTGTVDLGNASKGIQVENSSGNLIGGAAAADRNVISGNQSDGIFLWGAGSTLNIIQGNYIGVDATGDAALGNLGDGISISGGAHDNTIGGDRLAGEGNVLSGNGGGTSDGIEIGNLGANDNKIYGNYIGTNQDGTTAVANARHGAVIYDGVQGTLVGGTGTGQGNIISGNGASGIVIDGNGKTATSGNIISANLIGVDSTGTGPLGNTDDGIEIYGSASNNQIGGSGAAGNEIAWSGQNGVRISSGSNNVIIQNSIHSNTLLGIDLGTSGVSANGSGLQDYPVLTSAETNGTQISVEGTLNGAANTSYRIEVYSNDTGDASGYGEGQTLIGIVDTTTNGLGSATFSAVLNESVAAGSAISATVSRLDGGDAEVETSEFSQNAIATAAANTAPNDLDVTATSNGGLSVNEDSGNDVYLIADDGAAIFGGLTEFTVETRFSAETPPGSTYSDFISYAVASQDEEVWFALQHTSGTTSHIELAINGVIVETSGYNANVLFDGQQHTLTATWSSSGGAYEVFVDGASVLSGTGLKTGYALLGGGELTTVRDQDVPGGDFDVGEVFQGTLHDLRVFDDVRSNAEITGNYLNTLAYDEPGLVANWTFDNFSLDATTGNRIVTETVSGNNLTAMNVGAGGGYITSLPELTLAISENSADGTVVGNVVGTDADRTAEIAVLLTANPNLNYSAVTDKFYEVVTTQLDWDIASTTAQSSALNGTNGQLATIRSAAEQEIVADFAATSGQKLWLGATDETSEGDWRWVEGGAEADAFWSGDQNGSSVNGAYTNWLVGRPDNFADAQHYLLIQPDGLWNDEDIAQATVTGYIVEWDADSVLDSTEPLTYTIESQTVAGAFAIDAGSGQITVADGSFIDFETQPTHTLTVRVTDGGSLTYDEAFTIAVTDVNDAPTAVNDIFLIDEDTPTSIDLLVNDTDPENDTLTLLGFERVVAVYDAGTTGTAPDPTSITGGSWFFEDTEDANAATGNLQSGGVSPDGASGLNSWNITDSSNTFGENLWYSTTLSGTDVALADANGWSLSAEIRMVDDFNDTRTAFMRYGDGSTRFLAYFDLDANGDLQAELIDDSGSQFITLTSGGTGSADYHNFEIVYDSITGTAAFLADGVRVDDGSWSGQASTNEGIRWGMGSGGGQGSASYHSIEMKVFDQSITTANGATVTNNGDGTVNYAPAQDFNGADSFDYTIRDSDGHLDSATVNVTVDPVNDAPTGTTLVVAATEETATAIDISGNVADVDGSVVLTTTTVTGGPSNGSLTNNGDGTFSYTGNADYVGADSFTYTVEDNDGQVASDITVTINVSDVNDAPILTGANNLNSITEDDISNSGTLVSDLISGHWSDPDSSPLNGIAVVGADNTNGSWEYTTDSGSNWLSLGSPSSSFSRLLAADSNTLVRFVPSADYNGTVTNGITFHAWDQTTGNNGDVYNLSGQDSGTDSFSTVSYSNNDGTTPWATDWIENDNNGGGANSGYSSINAGTSQLQLAAGDSGDNIYREIDLSGATFANFSFDYQNVLSGEDEIRVQVSNNGGSSYTTFYTFSGTVNTGSGSASIDISSEISSDTRIRFIVFKNDAGNDLFIDNVSVSFDNGDPLPGGETAFSSVTQSSGITVTPVDDLPTVDNVIPDQTATEDTAYNFTLQANSFGNVDPGDTLTYSATLSDDSALPGWLDFDAGTQIFSGTPINADVGTISIKVTANDGTSSVSDIFTLTVTNANDAPVITSNGGAATANINVAENTTAITTVTATDVDLDTPIFSIDPASDDAAFFNIDPGTGVLTFAAAPDFETAADFDGDNIYAITVQVSDGNGGLDTQAISVTVTDVATNLVVTTLADLDDGDTSSAEALNASKGVDGSVSLSEAITAANNSSETITISFNISDPLVGGVHTFVIAPGGLPAITSPVIIDATTEPDYSGTPIIELDGSSAGVGIKGLTLGAGSDGSTIRGLVINRFDHSGILIDGSDGHTIAGNYIGTDATGNVQSGSDVQATGITINDSSGNTIGGTAASDANVLSGNRLRGVIIVGSTSTDNVVSGNFIGTNADGSAALTNVGGGQQMGVYLYDTPGNTIGGTATDAENVISGNTTYGIYAWGPNSTGNEIQGNVIGLDASLSTAIGNGNAGGGGIMLSNAPGNLVGGTTADAGNIISGHLGAGLKINGTGGTGNTVLLNTIYDNGTLGIDLGSDGVTDNDAGDVDAGANDLQNYPVITSAELDGTDLTLGGFLDTDGLATQYRIEIYGNAVGTQDATNGEARVYLGSTTVTTDGSGDATFSSVTLSGVTLSAGDYVTATATKIEDPGQVGIDDQLAYAATSEFAANALITVNTAPTTSGIADITLNEDPGFSFIDLKGVFADVSDADLALVYTITGNTNSALFDAASVNGSGILSLDYAADQNGSSDVTIRATDTGGLFVETTFTVTLNAVNDVPVRDTGTVSDLVVAEDSGLTSLGLGGVTYSVGGGADESSQTLSYEVVVIPDSNSFGKIFLADGTTQVTTGFYTLTQIQGMQFAPEPDENGGPSFFSFRVIDSGGTLNGGNDTLTETIQLDITAANDDPVFSSPNTFNVAENNTAIGTVTSTDVDGGVPQYTLVGVVDDGLFNIDINSGVLTFSAGPDFESPADSGGNNVYDLTVQVNDGAGGIVNQNISVTVTNVNETGATAIVDNDGALDTVNENASIGDAVGITAFSEDTDTGDTILYSLDDDAGGLFVIDSSSGVVTVNGVLDYETATSLDITVRATSTDTSATTRTFTIAIGDVNDTLPVVTPAQTFNINEDAAITDPVGTVLATDADTVGSLQNWTITAGNTDGVFALDAATGAITIANTTNLNFETTNQYTLTVQVGDGLNASVTETVVIDINDINEAPTFTSAPISTATEDTLYTYTMTTNDVDGDAVTITDLTIPAWLTLVDNGDGTATLSGTPTNAEVGGHTIDVQVSDGALTSNQSYTLTVANVNDDPVFSSPNAFSVTENNTAVGTVTSTDVDGGAPQYTLVGVVDDGLFNIDINSGVLTFSAGPDFESPADTGANNVYDLTVQVNDGAGGIVNQNIAVTVTNVNETGATAIVDTDGALDTVDEDASIGDAVGITAFSEDTDTGDTILYSLDDDAVGLFAIDSSSGVVTVNGVLDYETATSLDITVRATSTDTSATTRTFTIAIGDVNDTLPVVTPAQTFNVNENAAITDPVGTVLATDADTVGSLQNWTITAGNADGIFALDAATGAITIASTTNLNFEATSQYTLTVQVGDGINTSATQTVVIDINNINEAPTFTSTPVTNGTEDTLYTYTITTNDVDGDAVSITDLTIPAWLTLVDNGDGTATLSGTPTDAEVGGHSIDLQVSDGALATNQSSILTVANVNDDPVFSSPNTFNVVENNTTVGTVASTDVDGGAPQYTLVGVVDDGLFNIDINTGILTFATAPDFEAPADTGGDNVYDLTVQVNDGAGGIVSQNIAVTVTNTNETGASAISDTDGALETVNEDANIGDAVGITAFSTDTDIGDTISYTLDDDAGGLFTIDGTSGVVTVNGVLDYETATSLDITVRATSTDTSATTRTFTIAIGDVNDTLPVVTPSQIFNVNEDAAVADPVGTVVATDVDTVGSLQDWTITGGNADGVFAIDATSGAITIANTTNLNFEVANQYTLTVQVGDSLNTSITESVIIDINDINEAPTFTSTPITAATEDTLYTYTITTSDADGDALSFTGITVPPWLSLVDNGDGTATLSGTPTNTEVGGHVIDVQVSDGVLTSNQSFTLTVTNVNDDPVFSSPNTFNVAENNTAVGTVASTDVDGGAPQYTLVGVVDDGLFSIDINSGALTFDAGPDFEAPADAGANNIYDLTVQVNDGAGGIVNQSIAVTVTNVNETGATAIVDNDGLGDSVSEDANLGDAVGITAFSEDTDTGDTILYSLDDDAGGLFAIDGTSGVVTVNGVLDYETATSLDITVRATSTDTSATTRTFTIAIGDINDTLPVVTPAQTFNVNEDAVVTDPVGIVLATDADTVGSLQNWTITGGNTDGVFAIDGATGAVTIANTTNLNFEATSQYTLTVQVGDGINASATQTVVIDINDINEAPTFTSAPVTAATEDTLYTYTITTNDVDGDALSFTGITIPPWLTLVDNGDGTATLSGTPTNAEVGGHAIDVQVSDGALTSNQSFTLTVANVNDDPVFSSPNSFNMAENNTAVGTVASTDVDGGAPRYTLVGVVDDGLFNIDINSGVLTFNAGPDFEAPTDTGANNVYDLTVQVNDGAGGIVNQNVAVTVTNINETGASTISDTNTAPEAVNEDANIGYAVGITASATDNDTGDSILYTLDDSAAGLFAIDGTTGVITINGALDYETATSLDITVRATSTDTSATTRTFTIAIGDVNDTLPVVTPAQSFNVNENAIVADVVGAVLATDVDTIGSLQNWTITAGNADGIFALDAATGAITIANTTNLNFETTNQYTLTVQVGDGINTSAAQTVVIDINDVNEVPTAVSLDNTTADELIDTSTGYAVGTLSTSDPDMADTLTFSIVGGLDADVFTIGGLLGNELTLTDGVLDFEQQDTYEVTVRSTDASGLSIDRTFDISVNDLNDAPQAFTDTLVTQEDTALNIDVSNDLLVNDLDQDGDTLTLVSITQPSHGILVANPDGTWTYSPDANYNGSDQFQYEISDGRGATHWGTANVEVQAVNDTPTLTAPSTIDVTENSTGMLAQIVASDIDNDPVTLSISGGADRDAFTLDAQTGAIEMVGTPDFESPGDRDGDNRYDVEILVTDAAGATTSQMIEVAVNNVNEAPTIETSTLVSGDQFRGVIGTITAGDPDQGDQIAMTITGGSGAAAFSVDALTGEVVQQGTTQSGEYTLDIEVSDRQGVTTTGTLTITVEPSPQTLNGTDEQIPDPETKQDSTTLEILANRINAESSPDDTNDSIDDNIQDEGTTLVETKSNNLDQTRSPTNSPTIPGFDSSGSGTSPGAPSEPDNGGQRNYELVLELLLEEVDDLVGMVVEDSNMKSTQVNLSLTPAMLTSLDQMRIDIDDQHHSEQEQLELIIGAGMVTSISLTAGFVTWLVSTGSLLATALTTTPLWRKFDPIPVLAATNEKGEDTDV